MSIDPFLARGLSESLAHAETGDLEDMIEEEAPPARLTPEQLAAAGELLFGRNWKTELAEALGWRDSARVREMVRGRRPVPPGAAAELRAMLAARAEACRVLAAGLAVS